MRKLLVAASMLAGVLVAPSVYADAPPAVVAPGLSGQALLGYGFHDGVGLGLGVRVGYTLPDPNIYIGGTFMYHLGSDNVNVFYIGAEGGYDIAAGPVIVRPYLGLGPAWAHASISLGPYSSSTTESRFGVWPGCTVLYPINDQFYVGGDARFLIVSDLNAFSLFAVGGMHF